MAVENPNKAVESAIQALKKNEISQLKKNTMILSKISETYEKGYPEIANEDEEQETQVSLAQQEEDEESISSLFQASVKIHDGINSSLSQIVNFTTKLQQETAEIATKMTSINTLLASSASSLIQITGVLSAFRADHLLMSNGQTADGTGYINKQLISRVSSNIHSEDKNVRLLLADMKKAANFADLMSNAVRPKIGNTKQFKEDEGQGLLSKVLGKLSPDMAEVGQSFAPLLQMFNIDDSNVKTLLGSIMGPDKTKTILNPINELIGSWMNSPDNGKGFNAKQLLAGKINELTGFGDDTKQVKKERNSKLVMSALAPYADDIAQIVESQIESFSLTPKGLKKLAPYAKPVWVVNSKVQTNYFENKLTGEDKETRKNSMLLKKLFEVMNKENLNKRDKDGNEIFKDNFDGSFEGSLIDEIINSGMEVEIEKDDEIKTINISEASFNDQMLFFQQMREKAIDKKFEKNNIVKTHGKNADNEWVETEHDVSAINDLRNARTDNFDSIAETVMNPISLLWKLKGGVGGIKNTVKGAASEIANVGGTVMRAFHSGKKGKESLSETPQEKIQLAVLSPGEQLLSSEEMENKELEKEKVSMLGAVSGIFGLSVGVFKLFSANLVKYLNKERIDPKDMKIPTLNLVKNNPFKEVETKDSKVGESVKALMESLTNVLSGVKQGFTGKAEDVKLKKRRSLKEIWEEMGVEMPNQNQKGLKDRLKDLLPEDRIPTGDVDDGDDNDSNKPKDDKSKGEKPEGDNKDAEQPPSEATPADGSQGNEGENKEQTSQATPADGPSEEEKAEQEKQDQLNKENAEAIAAENEENREQAKAEATHQQEQERKEILKEKEDENKKVNKIREDGQKKVEKVKDSAVDEVIDIEKKSNKEVNKKKKDGAKKNINRKSKAGIRERMSNLKAFIKQKGLKLKSWAKEKIKDIASNLKDRALKIGSAIKDAALKLGSVAKNLAIRFASKVKNIAVKSITKIGKGIMKLVSSGISAVSGALSSNPFTLPVSPVPVIAGLAGLGLIGAGIYKAIKSGKEPKANGDAVIANAESEGNKAAEEEKKKNDKNEKAKTSGNSSSLSTNGNSSNGTDGTSFQQAMSEVTKSSSPTNQNANIPKHPGLDEELANTVGKSLGSRLGKILLNNPEQGANMAFAINGGSSALGLKDADQSTINNLKTTSNVSASSMSGIMAGATNSSSSSSGGLKNTNLADKRNNYSENVQLAWAQGQQVKNATNFINDMIKSSGLEVIEDENGNALSVNKIIKDEQLGQALGQAGVTTSVSSTGSSGSSSSSSKDKNDEAKTDGNRSTSTVEKVMEFLSGHKVKIEEEDVKKAFTDSKGDMGLFLYKMKNLYKGNKTGDIINIKSDNFSYYLKDHLGFEGTQANVSSAPISKSNASYGFGRRQSLFGRSNVKNPEFLEASDFAISKGYKETDGGTYPKFFKDYLGQSGINVEDSSIKQTKDSLLSGSPVILMGKDMSENGKTPFGDQPHYVVARGYDGKNIYIEDSESPNEIDVYDAKSTFEKSSIQLKTSSKEVNKLPTRSSKNSTQKNKPKHNKFRSGKGIKYGTSKVSRYGKGNMVENAVQQLGEFAKKAGETALNQTNETAKNATSTATTQYTNWLFCGDSRTVGLGSTISGIETIAQVGQGYDFFSSKLSEIKSKKGYNVVFWFGVNDLTNIDKYIKTYNELAKSDFGKNNKMIVGTVGPCQDKYGDDSLHGGAGQSVKEFNAAIDTFNKKLQSGGLDSSIEIRDLYTFLMNKINNNEDITDDCLHYNAECNKAIYNEMTNGAAVKVNATAGTTVTATNPLATIKVDTDTYVDASILEKYMKKNKTTTSKDGKNDESENNDKKNKKSDESILNNSMDKIKKEIENYNNSMNGSGSGSSKGKNGISGSGGTINGNGRVSLVDNDDMNIYQKDGTTYIRNFSNVIIRADIEKILKYFEELNNIQDDSLDVLEVIYGKLCKKRGAVKKTIKPDSLSRINDRAYSF